MRDILKAISLIALLLSFTFSHFSLAQSDTDLCPENFSEGTVSTGFVDCYRDSGQRSTRAEAELDRLEREAECIAAPRGEVAFSTILTTTSGRFFSRMICRIGRNIPAGTILCPDDSTEVFRAFDTLVCQYFGSAAESASAAMTDLTEDATACSAAPPGGEVIDSSIRTGLSQDDEEVFFFSDLSCGFSIPAEDTFACPVGFTENRNESDEDLLVCERLDFGLTSLSDAQAVNQSAQNICVNTTAGLGEVTEASTTADTSGNNTFFSEVTCEINLPRYTDFTEGDILRACDATCTEEVELTRRCVNGGVIGQPGCTEPSTEAVTQSCNTGTNTDSLCPILGVPSSNIVPLLLLEDEEDAD